MLIRIVVITAARIIVHTDESCTGVITSVAVMFAVMALPGPSRDISVTPATAAAGGAAADEELAGAETFGLGEGVYGPCRSDPTISQLRPVEAIDGDGDRSLLRTASVMSNVPSAVSRNGAGGTVTAAVRFPSPPLLPELALYCS